jgi:regulator of cell morphogenesis and NO signaling
MSGLSELEKDLHLHIHLENNILFPRAAQMETAQAVTA